MNISIQLSDIPGSAPITVDGDRNASPPAAGGAIDGGAPKAVAPAEGSESSASGVLDIGGPPQWLTEAIGRESGASASPTSDAKAEGSDAGTAPSF